MSDQRRDITHNIVFLRRSDEILLAMKLRGLGEGKWNGAGGKVKPGETVEEAAVREIGEEFLVEVTIEALKHVADIRFYGGTIDYVGTRVYEATEWLGDPTETEEMRPQWHKLSDIPYKDMWDGDKLWLPEVLAGRIIEAEIYFDPNNMVDHYEIRDLAEV